MKRPIPQVTNFTFTVLLISVAGPMIALMYADWRAAITAALLTQIGLGLAREKYSG